jgi:aminoglycoside phosphotransferase (APT) family kinase protein
LFLPLLFDRRPRRARGTLFRLEAAADASFVPSPADDTMTTAERQPGDTTACSLQPWMIALARHLAQACTYTRAEVHPLAGGVSSDIFRLELDDRTFCVKRALPKLKVAADWRVPVARNQYEAEWMRCAGAIVPRAVPKLLAEDTDAGAFAMEWLPPERYPVWKNELRDGRLDAQAAAAVGDALGRIHDATADRPDVAERFPTDALFEAIRLEPYLRAAAQAHPDLRARLVLLADTTASMRRVLVHGDFSPKNLLIGPQGPVILDAECAWFGDPAFDVAFVLNHLLLKGVWRPQWRARYVELFDALVDAYRAHVRWEDWAALDARTAALLPGLMLARVDGKSPAEYLTDARDRDAVRAFARAFVAKPTTTLRALARSWIEAAQ